MRYAIPTLILALILLPSCTGARVRYSESNLLPAPPVVEKPSGTQTDAVGSAPAGGAVLPFEDPCPDGT